MIKHQDFETFKTEISWFVKANTEISFLENKEFELSKEFEITFPKLTSLIEKARITHLEINKELYILFAWNNKEEQICGWLNKIENTEKYENIFIDEHILLLKNIGGIKESFNQPKYSFSNNQNFMFIGSECKIGIGDYDDYYLMRCKEEGMTQMNYSHLVAFVYEANGSLTLYDPKTKNVLLFSHDHSFDYVEFLENQPQYTFHSFKKAKTFKEYIEELATQWNEQIK